jgi:toxin FitB
MSQYLLDTNVLAEETQVRPNPGVTAWMTANRANSYTTALNIAELAFGVRRLANNRKRSALEVWLNNLVGALEGRILAFNERVAFSWADLQVELERAGQKIPIQDSYVAAIARRHALTVATRNTADFERHGVRTENPFKR